MVSLDKVLKLAGGPAETEPASAALVRAAAEDLEKIALLLADASDDDDDEPDDDGEDDDSKGDYENGKKLKGLGKKAPMGKNRGKSKAAKQADRQQVNTTARSLVLDAMLALSALQGGETLSLSVLSQKEREKPSAHTIAGSTDFPIPDEGHLTAAVREYHAGNLAGHSKQEVAAHIRASAKRLGKQVDLTESRTHTVLGLAKAQQAAVAMEHAPTTGEHDHAHRVVNVHSHKHTHNQDNRHDCGNGGGSYGGMY